MILSQDTNITKVSFSGVLQICITIHCNMTLKLESYIHAIVYSSLVNIHVHSTMYNMTPTSTKEIILHHNTIYYNIAYLRILNADWLGAVFT